jgi:hypothetical protein
VKRRRSLYRLSAGRGGLQLTLDEAFWSNALLDEAGTTQLDVNITTLAQEICAALYFVATDTTRH